ncbi:guanylate-binding protein 1 [Alosa sapidissima]|uniref:guanylate-binding protein 1 n=1 Tax=Alosa sapidissima TaxID=34773 RepID=UPI001C0913F3|nr:guanylate-binding protein 1 [Alosa sapidissima]XP_041940251.1 guanylate-binding protein 1 [Alosa sapidissima]
MALSMQTPVCLVDNGPDGHMRVQQEALQILEQIQQPVVVVAVVGLYRTGKSYLMNRLAGKHTGFALGSTIESKTKGVWMWCVPHPSKPGHTLVLLDTEGLGDVEKGDEKHDTWIFCLAVLLSSSLVYNSMGTIDNTALEKLQYVTELTEHIKVKSSGYDQTTELMRVFPSFVWTVRDFTLELILNDKPITADQYLENALKLKPGHSAKILRHNQVRQGLRDFFAERRCFVFERPADTKNMRRMEELTDADLDSDFVEAAKQFCSHIFSSTKPKTMRGGLGVTGRMLGSLAETYVKAIRSGQVPCLDSAVESLALIQNGRAVTEALEFYEKEMERWVRLPTETQEALSEIHAAAEKQAVSIFISGSFNDQEHKHQLELMRSVQERYEEWCRCNALESRRVCRGVLSRVFAGLDEAVVGGSYMRPGGYDTYRSDLEKATQLYRAAEGTGLLREEVLTDYLMEKSAVGENILAADRSLTEAQQRMEAEKMKREEAEQQQRLLEDYKHIQEQAIQDQQRSNQENLRQMEAKMEEQRQRAKEELERAVSAKLKEHQESLEEGFKERARLMQEEVDKLKQEQQEQEPPQGSSWLDTTADVLETGGMAATFVPGWGLAGIGSMVVGKALRWLKK